MDTPTTYAAPGRTTEFRIGDVFGRSFELFARRFAPFFGLTVVAYLPIYALLLIPQDAALGVATALAVVAFVLSIVCPTLASAAVTYGVVQELRGRPFTFSESLAVALRRFFPMIGVGLCVGILVGLATLLLIIPGMIVMCVYLVAAQACIVERTGVFASLSRSAALTKGHRWQIFGIVLVLFLVTIVVSALLGMILSASGTLTGLIGGTWQALAGTFWAVLGGVIYFQLRSVKEGFELDQIASVFD